MPVGAGLAPAGTSPYGIGTPDVAVAPGGSSMRSTRMAGQLNGRRFDPAKKDFQFDSFGRIAGMTTGQQNVYLSVQTDLGSSAVLRLGQSLRSIKTISSNFTRRVEETLTLALSGAVQRGEIQIASILVKKVGTVGALAHVRWIDLSTGQEQEHVVG